MIEDTPLFLQYRNIKNNYRDAVLFFRLGDFYEMFDDDAIEISRLLNLTLTHRTGRPMCGVPYHACRAYIARLLRLGKKVAICEQITQPSAGKGVLEREVVEVITPGTVVDEDYLDQGSNNYLACLCCAGQNKKRVFAFAYIDVSAGEFCGTVFPLDGADERLRKELARIQPKEILIQQSLLDSDTDGERAGRILCGYPDMVVNRYPDWRFDADSAKKTLLDQFGTASLNAFIPDRYAALVPAAGLLVDYLKNTARKIIPHIDSIRVYGDDEYVAIDESTQKNLELLQNLRDGGSFFTLFEALNASRTSMGARMLRKWIMRPLRDIDLIQKRLDRVERLYRDQKTLASIRDNLGRVLDLERLASRVAMDRAHAKDLVAIRISIKGAFAVFALAQRADPAYSPLDDKRREDIESLRDCLERSILDDPSVALNEGNIIRAGWSEELDRLRALKENSREVLAEYLEEEKRQSGISNLRIRYNRIIGYFIEVTKGQAGAAPSHFIRRQSLVNCERFTTDRLVEIESELNGAEERITALERALFLEVRERAKTMTRELLFVAEELAALDVLQSFAFQAALRAWIKPSLSETSDLKLREARHPVVEAHLPAGKFIPNDLTLTDSAFFALITGPNMAGKSTFLRQTALISLMAQIGSFVPASCAELPLVDRIFCRVGAADNIARGESTFLLEMNETAHILRSATSKSLIVMDEVGRGTSTEDGLAIAWAVSEYLLNVVKAKTLFATHYRELSRLNHAGLKKLCLDVLERDGSVVFLKKVIEGVSSNSYGVHVARLAGIPREVILRADEVLASLSASRTPDEPAPPAALPARSASYSLFPEEELILDEILSVDVDSITPLDALRRLAEWKKTLSGR